jgi:hypothetical protein
MWGFFTNASIKSSLNPISLHKNFVPLPSEPLIIVLERIRMNATTMYSPYSWLFPGVHCARFFLGLCVLSIRVCSAVRPEPLMASELKKLMAVRPPGETILRLVHPQHTVRDRAPHRGECPELACQAIGCRTARIEMATMPNMC